MKKQYDTLDKNEEDKALEIHKKSIVINGLGGPGSSVLRGVQFFDLMKQGGVTATNHTVGSSNFERPCLTIANMLKTFEIVGRDKYFSALSVEDIKKAKKLNGSILIFGFQNTLPLENYNINLLKFFQHIGVRIIQLTYQKMNLVGCGCGEIVVSGKDCGLSSFGISVVEEMNKLGILIDLSHVGHKTTMETIELSKYPVAFTHTNVRAINDYCRCKTDEEIQAVSETGGVIGVTALSRFINPRDDEGFIIPATMDDFLDNIDYIINLVGINHVGIGLDISEWRTAEDFAESQIQPINPEMRPPQDVYNRDTWYAKGIQSISQMPNITRGLVARGYSDQEISKILGGNFLNLFEKVWK